MKKMELSQMENLQGGRPCFGSQSVTTTNPQGCTQTCVHDYMFWILVDIHSCGQMVCPPLLEP